MRRANRGNRIAAQTQRRRGPAIDFSTCEASEKLGRHVFKRAPANAGVDRGRAIARCAHHRTREAEVGDHHSKLAGRLSGQDDVVALEIPVHDALRMRGIETGEKLPRDLSNLALGHPAIALDSLRQGFALEVLHRQKVDLPGWAAESMDVVELADVLVAHLSRISRFGGKAPAVTGPGAFDRHPTPQLLIEGLVDNAHPSVSDLADNSEALGENVSGLKRWPQVLSGNQRVHQEASHPLFPANALPNGVE